jgi:hypothetical protein
MSALATGRSALVLKVSFKVLLHIVGACEFLLASCKSALNSLLCGVDLGMARGMT